ncbi:hypothetical protein FQN53_008780 [Emmonsiellopsis sp. PD_33]|nr:hypothetical protein FQN53_008780 [Emmonsiellopsis sp. PD_33]
MPDIWHEWVRTLFTIVIGLAAVVVAITGVVALVLNERDRAAWQTILISRSLSERLEVDCAPPRVRFNSTTQVLWIRLMPLKIFFSMPNSAAITAVATMIIAAGTAVTAVVGVVWIVFCCLDRWKKGEGKGKEEGEGEELMEWEEEREGWSRGRARGSLGFISMLVSILLLGFCLGDQWKRRQKEKDNRGVEAPSSLENGEKKGEVGGERFIRSGRVATKCKEDPKNRNSRASRIFSICWLV